MASKGKTRKSKSKGKGQADLEAIGLVLLAFGTFSLGLLIPQLPTGEFGDGLRGAALGSIGVGAYAVPWPFLAIGGLFLLRRSPRAWPRVLLGYLMLVAGTWAVLVVVRPGLTGGWGEALRSVLTGAAGALTLVPALFLVTLGAEAILGLRPTSLSRSAAVGAVATVRAVFRAAVRARNRAKARAAFGADVALERNALAELDRDLKALSALYPGSTELDKWRKAVETSRGRLSGATPEVLEDVRLDVRAWQEAVGDFARDRASELGVALSAEGARDFDAWSRGVKAQLDDPIMEGVTAGRALDELRKTMALDHTALVERHRRLTRERDLAVTALREVSPRKLVGLSEEHSRRLAQYRKLQADADELGADTDALEGWRDLIGRLAAARAEFRDHAEVQDYDETLAKELRERRRKALGDLTGWAEALEAVLARARSERLAVAAAVPVMAGSAGGSAEATEDGRLPGVAVAELEPHSDDQAEAEEPPPTFVDIPWEVDDDELSAFVAPAPPAADWGDGEAEPEGHEEELPEVGGIPIQVPPHSLLDALQAGQEDPVATAREVKERVRKIDETLANFKLEGRVVSSVRGPTVTRFEVEPAPGEKISRFANLSDDLALAMAVGSVRIEAPIPGKSVIGLEVPNANRDLIRFREAAESPAFKRSKSRLPLILGKSIDGDMVVADLAKMPHLLIAGSTGSGKSVAVNTLIGSLLFKFLPTELRFLMIDPKMVELTPYDGIPHLLRPVVTNPNDAAGVLLGAVAHMERRYKMMSRIGAKNLDQYNEKAKNLDMPQLPFITIIIDELADLMITSPKEVESAIMRLAQMARATGMHLVLATQRPSVDILTSLIKVNVPARMAFAVSSGHDSRTILDTMGAERLVGMGDMLYYQPGLVKPSRLQGPYISENEIAELAGFLRRQYFDDEFVEAYGSDFDPPAGAEGEAEGLIDWNDDKLRAAAELVIQEGQASVSRLQRRLQVGHARAGKLMDSLEALGVVGPHVGSKPRDVLVDLHELPDIFGK